MSNFSKILTIYRYTENVVKASIPRTKELKRKNENYIDIVIGYPIA
uniref:Catalytic n=1 Tax=Rhizophora mucronata TaxID=61149 RepID=A0A2P2KJH7_RHIMU